MNTYGDFFFVKLTFILDCRKKWLKYTSKRICYIWNLSYLLLRDRKLKRRFNSFLYCNWQFDAVSSFNIMMEHRWRIAHYECQENWMAIIIMQYFIFILSRKTFFNKIKLGKTIDLIENELFIDALIKSMKISVYIYSFFMDVFYNFQMR